MCLTLRSPLTRLRVALELARENSRGAMQVHLDRIEREAVQLNTLVSGTTIAILHGVGKSGDPSAGLFPQRYAHEVDSGCLIRSTEQRALPEQCDPPTVLHPRR